MSTRYAVTVSVRPQCRGQGVPCPGCGSIMVQTDRIVENGFVCTWYGCTAAGCTEQWLAKRLAPAEPAATLCVSMAGGAEQPGTQHGTA